MSARADLNRIVLTLLLGLATACDSPRTIPLYHADASPRLIAPEGRFPSFLSHQRMSEEVELAGTKKPALTPPFPARLELDVELPDHPFFTFSIGVNTPRRTPRARVDFTVRVVSEGHTIAVFHEPLLVDDANQWHDRAVNLDAWAGKNVTLRMETSPMNITGPVRWADRMRTVWGEPKIESRALGPPPRQASVILIVVDTLRFDYLGIHGFEGDVSPNLDWLAMESVRFDNAFSAAPWTKPSVASILTGLHPNTHGVMHHGPSISDEATDVLSDEAFTLAEAYREHGYETVAFVANLWLAKPYGYAQGFDSYVTGRDRHLLDGVSEWLRSRDETRPYFLYLHLTGVHGPYSAPRRDYVQIQTSPSLGEDRRLSASDPEIPRYMLDMTWDDPDEGQRLRPWKAQYAAGVRYLERRLGTLIHELRTSGRLDHDWLVFTSDHGEEFLEHGRWEHGRLLCDHQLHVPLWIRRPGAAGAGQRIDAVVSLVDLMPTLLGLTGLEPPAAAQGEDLSQWLGPGVTLPRRRMSYSTALVGDPHLHTLRSRQHRIVWDETTDAYELYDTLDDPGEMRDLAEHEPLLGANFRDLLLRRLADFSQDKLGGETAPIPNELRERLRALGYLQ